MPGPKPSSHLDWTDGAVTKVDEPTAAYKLLGWLAGQRPPFKFMNWLFFRTDEWNKYFEDATDELLSFAGSYDATVGTGPSFTHATLAAALADVGILPGSRIFVAEAAIIAATIVVAKNDITVDFHPRATYSAGAATTCIQLSADRARINDGRFTGFTTQAILIDVTSDYNRVTNNGFQGNTLNVTDNSTTSLEQGSIYE